MPKTLLIVLIAVLAVHYFLAVGTVYRLLQDKGFVKAVIPWNLVILLVPVLGPAAYWLARCFCKKKKVAQPAPAQGEAAPLQNGAAPAQDGTAPAEGRGEGEEARPPEPPQA